MPTHFANYIATARMDVSIVRKDSHSRGGEMCCSRPRTDSCGRNRLGLQTGVRGRHKASALLCGGPAARPYVSEPQRDSGPYFKCTGLEKSSNVRDTVAGDDAEGTKGESSPLNAWTLWI